MNRLQNALIVLLLVILLAGTAFAAPKFQGDRKAEGDEFDSFKSNKTVAVMEKTNRIKREKVTAIKAYPLYDLMGKIALDGRLEKLIEILDDLSTNDADSCPGCWSVYNRIYSSAVSTNRKIVKKAMLTKVNKKTTSDDNKDSSQTTKRREPNIQVTDATYLLFTGVAASSERDLIQKPIEIMYEKLTNKEGMTPGEHDYFSILASLIMEPFLEEEEVPPIPN